MPCSGISIEIPVNGIFHQNSILAYFDDPRYRRKRIYAKIPNESRSIFFIPEEVHILPGSSSIMVWNNSIIGVDSQITLNIRSRVSGLVRTYWRFDTTRNMKKKFQGIQNIRPVVTYKIMDDINLGTLFPPDPLQERENVQL
ncbi:hypothetical protein H5410_046562 [Solanum commersonii]|uniref:Uncharacterized protein n=1 Tax=Solanum commersonii TaxID=4109 RepID=A0A9J5XGU8_SOLCO|nr:hypothetical protein H5410_046562 [Solanum commersonii]